MVDQAFDVVEAVLALRVRIAVVVGDPAPVGHIGRRLLYDAQTLAHLLEPHQVAGETIPALGAGPL